MAAITAAMRTSVTQLYTALFGRAPEADGLGYWVNAMAGGKSMQTIAGEMYATTDARVQYPLFLTNSEIVTTFYTNTLGRAPDQAGLDYWTAALNNKSVGVVISEMITAVTSWSDTTDAAAISSQQLFNNKIAVGEYFAETLRSNDVTLAATVINSSNVTTAASSVTAAQAVAANAGATAVAQTFTLTTSADAFVGGTGNDVFNAGADKLGSNDLLQGGAGTDVLNVTMGSGAGGFVAGGGITGVAPEMSAIESINITFRDASGALDLVNAQGYNTISINGVTDGAVGNLKDNASVTFDAYKHTATLALNKGADLTPTSNVDSANFNTLTLTMQGNSSAGFRISTAGTAGTFEKLVLNLQQNVNDSANDFNLGTSLLELDVTGSGNLTLRADTAFGAAASGLHIFDASKLTGNFSLGLDGTNSPATGLLITGGAGNDTFTMSAMLKSDSTIHGGTGTDSMSFTLNSTSTIRPTVDGVETFTVKFASAGQIDGRNMAGLTTINTDASAAAGLYTQLNTVSALNVTSAVAGNGVSYAYRTGSNVDVVIGLGKNTTASDSAFAMSALVLAGNSGAVTINNVNSAGSTVTAVSVDTTALVTLANNASTFLTGASGGLTVQDFSANNADSVTFTVGGTMNIGSANIGAATSLNINATNSASTFSAATLVANGLQTLTINVSGTDGDQQSIMSGTYSTSLTTVNVTSTSTGDVFLGTSVINVASAQTYTLTETWNVNTGASGVQVLGLEAGTAQAKFNETLTLKGGADYSFVFSAAGTATFSAGTLTIDASTMATGSVSATVSGIYDSGALSVTLGAGYGYIVGDAGADTVVGGAGTDHLYGLAGNDSLDGGAGNDTIYGGAGNDYILGGAGNNTIYLSDGTDTIELLASTASTNADTIVMFAGDTGGTVITAGIATAFLQAGGLTANGTDTILNFRSGDKIVFAGFTASAGAMVNSSQSAGITAAFQSSIFSSVANATANTALGSFAIYSNGADTVIEVLVGTASGGSLSSAVEKVVLDSVTWAGAGNSSQFRLTYDTAAGLTFTLIS